MRNNIVALRPRNNKPAGKSMAASTLQRALAKDKSSSVDFYKIAIGDSKENQRLKLRQHTDSLKR